MTPYYEEAGIVIYHGDCREVLPEVSADVLVTDPPYGMGFVSSRSDGKGWSSRWKDVPIAGDENATIRDDVLNWWGDRPALVFGTWKVSMPISVREVLVWDKVVSTGLGALDIPWKPSWEAVYVIGKGFKGARTHGVLR